LRYIKLPEGDKKNHGVALEQRRREWPRFCGVAQERRTSLVAERETGQWQVDLKKNAFQDPRTKELLRQGSSECWTITKYFFSELREGKEYEFDGLLHGLLWQILSQRRELIPVI
jgi:hypothetical protein